MNEGDADVYRDHAHRIASLSRTQLPQLAFGLIGLAPGPFQTEAAIAAVHSRAPTADATEWAEIASLYARLEDFRAAPAVRVNRAFAVVLARLRESAHRPISSGFASLPHCARTPLIFRSRRPGFASARR